MGRLLPHEEWLTRITPPPITSEIAGVYTLELYGEGDMVFGAQKSLRRLAAWGDLYAMNHPS
jgi:hypothetical protein